MTVLVSMTVALRPAVAVLACPTSPPTLEEDPFTVIFVISHPVMVELIACPTSPPKLEEDPFTLMLVTSESVMVEFSNLPTSPPIRLEPFIVLTRVPVAPITSTLSIVVLAIALPAKAPLVWLEFTNTFPVLSTMVKFLTVAPRSV